LRTNLLCSCTGSLLCPPTGYLSGSSGSCSRMLALFLCSSGTGGFGLRLRLQTRSSTNHDDRKHTGWLIAAEI
jgi:hypothetical protein